MVKLDDPFWRRSPFGAYAASIADSVCGRNRDTVKTKGKDLKPNERSRNPYFNIALFNYLKVHIFPYSPILNHSMFKTFKLSYRDDTTNIVGESKFLSSLRIALY